MGTAEILLPYGPLDEVSYYLIPIAKKASVPVVVHLDHGLTYDTCIKALELGFNNIIPRIENHEGITEKEVDDLYIQLKNYKVKNYENNYKIKS